jgi:RimJ/RimL family protein N-acetyltransferase
MTYKRAVTIEDLDKMHYLFSNIVDEMRKYYVNECIDQELKQYSLKNFREKYIKSGNYAFGLYTDANDLVGFQLFYLEGGVAFIEWIGIDVNHRGKKYGKLMDIELCSFLLKSNLAHKLFCDCLVINKESIGTLTASGYTKIGEVKNFWFNQDYYLWEKELAR